MLISGTGMARLMSPGGKWNVPENPRAFHNILWNSRFYTYLLRIILSQFMLVPIECPLEKVEGPTTIETLIYFKLIKLMNILNNCSCGI